MSAGAPVEGAEEQFELSGPEDDGWYGSQLKDWVPVAHGLSDGAARFYWILRALIIEKRGKVRKLTMWECCCLMPTRSGAPSSRSRIRDFLKELSAPEFLLLTTPEGGRITVSSRAKAAGRPIRIRVNDYPPASYTGHRNVFAALDAIRAKAAELAAKAVREEAEREAARKAAKAAEDAGQNSVPPGQNSVPPGQNSVPHQGSDLGQRNPPLTPAAYSLRSDAAALPNAVGQGSGGVARAGAREGAAGDDGGADGGCAAAGKDSIPQQQQQHRQAEPEKQPVRARSPRPKTVKTTPRQMPAGYELVRAAVPPEVATPGSGLYVGLRRAIADLLEGNPAAGIPARTPEQVITRMNRRWYAGRGPERSAAGYVPSTTAAEDRPIASPSAWLAKALLHQDCADAACEDGMVIGTGAACVPCVERRASRREEREAREAAEHARAVLTEDVALHERDLAAYQEVLADLERRLRAEHGRHGLDGPLLDEVVNAELARLVEEHYPVPIIRTRSGNAPVRTAPTPRADSGKCPGWDGGGCGKHAVTSAGLCTMCHGHTLPDAADDLAHIGAR